MRQATQWVRCVQVVNFSEDIRAQLYKIASISLCSNLGGQVIMSLVMNPPKVRTFALKLRISVKTSRLSRTS